MAEHSLPTVAWCCCEKSIGDQLLVSYLRPSSVGAAHHSPAVTKLLVEKIRSRWPNVKIIVRGDGGFAIEKLMRWCDKNDVNFVFNPTYERSRINGRQFRQVKKPGTNGTPVQNPEDFYRTMYCPRGEMENRIKEQQLCLFADRTNCTQFMANLFRLMLSSFAYVLLDGIRRLGLSGTKQSRWRVDTIRFVFAC